MKNAKIILLCCLATVASFALDKKATKHFDARLNSVDIQTGFSSINIDLESDASSIGSPSSDDRTSWQINLAKSFPNGTQTSFHFRHAIGTIAFDGTTGDSDSQHAYLRYVANRYLHGSLVNVGVELGKLSENLFEIKSQNISMSSESTYFSGYINRSAQFKGGWLLSGDAMLGVTLNSQLREGNTRIFGEGNPIVGGISLSVIKLIDAKYFLISKAFYDAFEIKVKDTGNIEQIDKLNINHFGASIGVGMTLD